MATDVKVPGVGESVQEGMIESWHKSSGDWVERDEVLLELETDKATVEVVSEATGVLSILAKAGRVVRVGDVIARIDDSSSRAAAPEARNVGKAAEAPSENRNDDRQTLNPDPGPAVRRMLAEQPVDIASLTGTGKGGRLTKADLLTHIRPDHPEPPPPRPERVDSLPPPEQPDNRPLHALEAGREQTRKPMSMIRRRIAERLLAARKDAAILTTFNEVDMSGVMALRKKYKEPFQKRYGIKLGFMGFFLKASVHGLESIPAVNAYVDGTDILFHNYCDIGVAVSTDKGLMVPVIRDVDKLSLAETELAIAGYAEKARNNKITLDDLSGGTFTVSNGGVFGSLLSTPILNPPQSAILGMHKTQMRPIVMPDGSIQARPMMYLAVSYDHRLIDGKEAVGFLVKIKEVLEDPARLLLGV